MPATVPGPPLLSRAWRAPTARPVGAGHARDYPGPTPAVARMARSHRKPSPLLLT